MTCTCIISQRGSFTQSKWRIELLYRYNGGKSSRITVLNIRNLYKNPTAANCHFTFEWSPPVPLKKWCVRNTWKWFAKAPIDDRDFPGVERATPGKSPIRALETTEFVKLFQASNTFYTTVCWRRPYGDMKKCYFSSNTVFKIDQVAFAMTKVIF